MTTTKLLSFGHDLDIFADHLRPHDDDLIRQQLIPPIPITPVPNPILIWGWAFARRAHDIGITEMEVRVVDVSPIEGLKVALGLENRTGQYSWAEQLACVDRFERAYEDAELPEADWLDLSELVRGDGGLQRVVRQYRRLMPLTQGLVADGFISLKTARRIQVLPEDFILGSRHLLNRLSYSSRRQFLEVLSELAIHAAPTDAADSDPRVVHTTSEHTGSVGSVTEVCRWAISALEESDPLDAIRRVRYPTLTGLETELAQIRDRALRGSGVDLSPPPYFEGDSYRVAFQFRDHAELQRRIRALERLKDNCEDLARILR